MSVTAQKGVLARSGEAPVSLQALPLPPRQLVAPRPKEVFRSERFDYLFQWSPVAEAQAYRIEIARDPDFFDLVEERRIETGPSVRIMDLEPGTYFWRITAVNPGGFEGSPAGESYFVFVRPQP